DGPSPVIALRCQLLPAAERKSQYRTQQREGAQQPATLAAQCGTAFHPLPEGVGKLSDQEIAIQWLDRTRPTSGQCLVQRKLLGRNPGMDPKCALQRALQRSARRFLPMAGWPSGIAASHALLILVEAVADGSQCLD